MALTFVFEVDCSECKTRLRFENERPDWKLYDVRVEEPDRVAAAAAYVQQYADEVVPREVAEYPAWVYECPRYAGLNYETRRMEVSTPTPARYIECPVCDTKIFERRLG